MTPPRSRRGRSRRGPDRRRRDPVTGHRWRRIRRAPLQRSACRGRRGHGVASSASTTKRAKAAPVRPAIVGIELVRRHAPYVVGLEDGIEVHGGSDTSGRHQRGWHPRSARRRRSRTDGGCARGRLRGETCQAPAERSSALCSPPGQAARRGSTRGARRGGAPRCRRRTRRSAPDRTRSAPRPIGRP